MRHEDKDLFADLGRVRAKWLKARLESSDRFDSEQLLKVDSKKTLSQFLGQVGAKSTSNPEPFKLSKPKFELTRQHCHFLLLCDIVTFIIWLFAKTILAPDLLRHTISCNPRQHIIEACRANDICRSNTLQNQMN